MLIFNSKYSMNAINDQIRKGIFTRPFSYRHLVFTSNVVFSAFVYGEIKYCFVRKKQEVLDSYLQEEIKINQFRYILGR